MGCNGKTFEISYDEKPNPKSEGTFYRTIMTIKEVGEVDKAYLESKNSQYDNKPATISTDMDLRLHNIENRLSLLEGSSSTTPAVNTPETGFKSDIEALAGRSMEEATTTETKVEEIPF